MDIGSGLLQCSLDTGYQLAPTVLKTIFSLYKNIRMIKQFLEKTILGKFSRWEKKIKKHEPNLKEISKDSHEYKYFLF